MPNIAVLGHGVVGSGVVELLRKNSGSIARRTGEEIAVRYILDKRDFPGVPYVDRFVKDFDVILRDESVAVVVEVMGGVNPAYDFVKASLLAGKSAVTSNKEMVAEKGAELLGIAREKNVSFRFEASVGGGIPVIRPLHECLAANEIEEIAGILNGTTNFILTKMIGANEGFEDALAEAQRLGYAEANPAADVEGRDSCRKIAILASLAFGSHVYPECVRTRGISALTLADVAYAESIDSVIKLLGWTRRADDGKVFAMAGPAFLRKDSRLAGVDDVFNGVLVRGDMVGDVAFYGRGAGKLPTASAVVGDVIACLTDSGNVRSLWWADSDRQNVADYKASPASLYVRADVSADAVRRAFGDGVRILERENAPEGERAFITPALPEGEIEQALAELASPIHVTCHILDY